MLPNAQVRGDQLITGLRGLQTEFPVIGDVRGLGLMVGTEFRDSNKKPDKTTAKAIVHACLDDKLLLLTCGAWDNTVRWIPPLIVTESQVAEALAIFRSALLKVTGQE
jgi:4-aminobutyrate aminotransferase